MSEEITERDKECLLHDISFIVYEAYSDPKEAVRRASYAKEAIENYAALRAELDSEKLSHNITKENLVAYGNEITRLRDALYAISHTSMADADKYQEWAKGYACRALEGK